MNLFESINKGFATKYGDLDSKKEKKVVECGKVGVQKESCNKKVKECADTRFRGKKEIKEYKDMGQDLSEYQKWVDYDMKRYHKISDKTMGEIKKAGLSVVKDQYGAYEVIAKEPVREAVKNVDPRMSDDESTDNYTDRVKREIDSIRSGGDRYTYAFLFRLKEDNDYFLGNGDGYTQGLFMGM